MENMLYLEKSFKEYKLSKLFKMLKSKMESLRKSLSLVIAEFADASILNY